MGERMGRAKERNGFHMSFKVDGSDYTEPRVVKVSAVDCSRQRLITNVCMGKGWVQLAL